jgi:hypothetical protein
MPAAVGFLVDFQHAMTLRSYQCFILPAAVCQLAERAPCATDRVETSHASGRSLLRQGNGDNRMRAALIGTGIGGNAAAWALSKRGEFSEAGLRQQ